MARRLQRRAILFLFYPVSIHIGTLSIKAGTKLKHL